MSCGCCPTCGRQLGFTYLRQSQLLISPDNTVVRFGPLSARLFWLLWQEFAGKQRPIPLKQLLLDIYGKNGGPESAESSLRVQCFHINGNILPLGLEILTYTGNVLLIENKSGKPTRGMKERRKHFMPLPTMLPRHEKVLRLLLKNPAVSREIYDNHFSGGSEHLGFYVHKLRKQLTPLGVRIETKRDGATHYLLSEANKTKVRKFLTNHASCIGADIGL